MGLYPDTANFPGPRQGLFSGPNERNSTFVSICQLLMSGAECMNVWWPLLQVQHYAMKVHESTLLNVHLNDLVDVSNLILFKY